MPGTAVAFPGASTTYGQAANDDAFRSPVFTVAFWSKANPAGGHECPVGARFKDPPDAGDGGWTTYYYNGQFLYWVSTGGGGWGTIEVPIDSAWHHFTCVYDGAQMHLYIDGVETAGSPVSSTYRPDSTETMMIGRNPQGFPLTGSVDDIQFYTRALSADQALTLYQNPGSTIADETPVGDWMLY